MSNNNLNFIRYPLIALAFAAPAKAEVELAEPDARPVFQQIADLEQERVLLQLEKEKAQLSLELDRIAVEQARLRNDMERMSGREDEEAQRLELERQKLEQERDRLAAQREKMEDQARSTREAPAAAKPAPVAAEPAAETSVSKRYRLVEIVGVGRQLQATLEDLGTGQRKKVWAGREIDGYSVQSVSLDDGVVFVRDGVSESLNISGGRE